MKIYIANENEKQKAYILRFEVFVDEQQIAPELEIDEKDGVAIHVIAEEDGLVVGCARAILGDDGVQIGRLAVKKAYRRRGIGEAICRFVINDCRTRGYRYFWLHAQLSAVGFYQKLGFKPIGDSFTEDGIEHIEMIMSI